MADETSEDKAHEVIDPIALFSPKVRNAVEGLTFLGELSETVSFCGHTFGLRTLKPQHKYAISRVLQPYRNTIYEVQIFQNLHVATALTHVDGKHNFCDPIGPSIEEFVIGRLNFVSDVKNGWYEATLEYLWSEYQVLELKATEAIVELHSLSQRSRENTSSPLPDSSTELASLEELMNLGILPSMTFN